MARRTAAKIVPPAVIFLFTGTLIFSTILVEAQEEPEPTDQELAEKFAPILSLMFALAVLMNGLHSYAIRNAAGLNSFTVILTWSSVLILVAVMAWSLRRQRLCIEKELLDEIPESLYVTVTEPWAGTKQQWRALRSGGISNWRRTRRLRQLCAELAFKKMQSRLFSDEPEMADEAEALRKEVKSLSAQPLS